MNTEQARLDAAMLSGGVSSSAIYNAVLLAAQRAKSDPSTILDFGSGAGQLLPLLRQNFPEAALHAADIMERPVDLSPSVVWHRSDLNDAVAVASGMFSMIFAVEVIEHLENPRQTIREIARLLAPDGVAVLSTPNPSSVRSLITFAVRGHHAQFDDSNYPAHITPVSALDFTRMAHEAGLSVETIFYTDSGAVPKFLSRRWQDAPLLGQRLRGKWFSDNFGVVLRSASPAH